MCRGIVPAEHLVEWKHRAKIEIHLLAELAIDFMHVAAELFEQKLEAVEHGVECRLIASEICADKFLECSSIAVLGPPELGNLMQPAFQACALCLAVFADQFAVEFRTGSVRCGWIVNATSFASAPISIARTPSAISSPAPAPTMPTPSTRSLCGSRISLVMPSVRSRVIARPEAAQGNFATLISRFCFCASVSVRPHQEISGSVKTTAGMAFGSNATL